LETEVKRLKFLNTEEQATIEELSQLCLRGADALENLLSEHERFEPSMEALISQLRKAAE